MALPHTEFLLLKLDGPFLHVTLNRPEARNALSLGMASELMQVFDAVRNDACIRGLVICGAGQWEECQVSVEGVCGR